MPFIKKIELEVGTVGIWELTETAEELNNSFVFSSTEKEEFEKIRSDKRKKEYIASRLILQELLNKKIEIEYLITGKPILKNTQLHISISHSENIVVVIVSNHKIGIDVEILNRNIDQVARRFLSKEEYNFIQNASESQSAKIIYWGAKESIFKCSDYQGVHFYQQIFIHPFKIKNEGSFSGKLISGNITENYKLCYFPHQNNMIVFCVEDKNDPK